MTTSDFFERVESVHHDWRYDHPRILYSLIRSLRPKVVVECGTYRGYSASYMARALQENGSGHLYCIDNFSLTEHVARYGDPRAHLEANLKAVGVRGTLTLLDGDSDKVTWPANLGFAYLDGWHGYLGVRGDFERAAKLGAECICFDDTTQSVGPRLLMQEIRAAGLWDVLDVRRDCGLTICMRRMEKGPITFSQELPGSPGLDLQTVTHAEREAHFAESSKVNGVDYDPILNVIHPGRGQ